MIKELIGISDSFGLNHQEVIKRLIEIGKKTYADLLDSTKMPPVHYNHYYFAMASLLMDGTKNVLEIGTGSGKSTQALAKLFPGAMIYTIDVPPDDPDYLKSWRGRNSGRFVSEISENTHFDNVTVVLSNSFYLPSLNLPEQFELIFVDGSHVYPAVAWDIMFSYSRIAVGGFMFMHDYEVEMKTLNHVKCVVEYMRSRIKEKIWLFPEYADPKWKNGKMACLVKQNE